MAGNSRVWRVPNGASEMEINGVIPTLSDFSGGYQGCPLNIDTQGMLSRVLLQGAYEGSLRAASQ